MTGSLFVLWNGVAGSAMPAWRDLPAEDLAALAAVVREHAASAEPAPPQQIVDLGQQVYKENCAQCHGDNGAGDGPAGREIRMAPASFVTAQPGVAESLRVLRNGIEGSPMAPSEQRAQRSRAIRRQADYGGASTSHDYGSPTR